MTAQPFMPTTPLVGTSRNAKSAARSIASPAAAAAPASTARRAAAPAAPGPAAVAPAATAPAATALAEAESAVEASDYALEAAQAPDRSLLARIWNAYRVRRNAARMRNIAQDMEPHMLDDVGAPQWLINEASVRRDLSRLRPIDYIRW